VERKKREDVCKSIWVFLFREERGMMGFDIVSFRFISYHVYSLGLELLFILSILSLYTTILCFSLYPYFIINVYKLTWDWAAVVCFGYILLAVLYIVYIALAINREEFSTFY